MSAQLNCMLKHQHSDSDRQLQSHQSPLQFSASVIMQVCVCVCARSVKDIDFANVLWSAMPVQLQCSLSLDLI